MSNLCHTIGNCNIGYFIAFIKGTITNTGHTIFNDNLLHISSLIVPRRTIHIIVFHGTVTRNGQSALVVQGPGEIVAASTAVDDLGSADGCGQAQQRHQQYSKCHYKFS